MIALALLVISAGCALLYVAACHLQETLDGIDQAPAWSGELLELEPVDWDWPDPHPSITNRKVHNGTENRPT